MEEQVKKIEEEDNVIGTVKVDDEAASWDDVHGYHKGLAETIIEQQVVIVNAVNDNKDIIANDKELNEIIVGLSKTFTDVTDELTTIGSKFMTNENYTGIVNENDEEATMLYIGLMQEYIGLGDKISRLAEITVTDVLIMIKTLKGE